jgi:replicative DNA helicase
MTELVVANPEMEEGVLGAMMVSDQAVTTVLAGSGLAARHFYRPRHQLIFGAIEAVADRGDPVDAVTITDELARRRELEKVGGRDVVASLAANCPAPGNAVTYVARVIEDATWRNRHEAALAIVDACGARDDEALGRAEAMLGKREGHADAEYDSNRQSELIWEMAEGREEPGLPWPFPRLTASCAIDRGTLTVLSGLTNTGKSMLADQMLDLWHKRGLRCALYLNEGTVKKRLLRRIARRTNVPIKNVRRGKLQGNERELLLREMNAGSWPMVAMHGWTATEVAHHIRRQRWEGCVVDLLNRFSIDPRIAERQYADIVNTFADAAAMSGCAVVLVAQVNRGSAQGATAHRRKPVVSDLKGSGDIETHADTVAFVYRDRDSNDEMEMEGEVYFDKTRDGQLDSVAVTFNPSRLRFEVR